MLKVSFLPANQCYAVTFGDSLVRLEGCGRTLFDSSAELVAELNRLGIIVTKLGSLVVVPGLR